MWQTPLEIAPSFLPFLGGGKAIQAAWETSLGTTSHLSELKAAVQCMQGDRFVIATWCFAQRTSSCRRERSPERFWQRLTETSTRMAAFVDLGFFGERLGKEKRREGKTGSGRGCKRGKETLLIRMRGESGEGKASEMQFDVHQLAFMRVSPSAYPFTFELVHPMNIHTPTETRIYCTG